MSSIVTVGLLSVEIFDGKVTAVVTIGGPQPTEIDVGAAAGRRIFDELTKIREALLAANAVLRDPVTKTEMHLANLLVDLEIVL